jgi:hypothetical protein
MVKITAAGYDLNGFRMWFSLIGEQDDGRNQEAILAEPPVPGRQVLVFWSADTPVRVNPIHPQIPPGTLQSTFNAEIQLKIRILSLG